jgi:hypothetical protein
MDPKSVTLISSPNLSSTANDRLANIGQELGIAYKNCRNLAEQKYCMNDTVLFLFQLVNLFILDISSFQRKMVPMCL